MIPGNSLAIHEKSFAETLDNACTRLQVKQALYSLKRLDKLDAILCELEADLEILVREAVSKGF